jgi:thymidine kinase
MAKLYFNYSTMNAGKSTVLLQASHNYIERGMQTYLLTAQFDNRAGEGRIESRIGIGEDADTYRARRRSVRQDRARLDAGPCACVFIDEAQFLTPAQVWQLARAVDDLGVPVMAFGLRVDFRGELFPGSAALLALSDEMREVRTICHCGRKATMVVRKGEGRPGADRRRPGRDRRQRPYESRSAGGTGARLWATGGGVDQVARLGAGRDGDHHDIRLGHQDVQRRHLPAGTETALGERLKYTTGMPKP